MPPPLSMLQPLLLRGLKLLAADRGSGHRRLVSAHRRPRAICGCPAQVSGGSANCRPRQGKVRKARQNLPPAYRTLFGADV